MEYTWIQDHPIKWNEARVLDHTARTTELVLKEIDAVHLDDF